MVGLVGVIFLMKYLTTAKWSDSYRAYLAYSVVGMALASVVMATFGVLAILERNWFIVLLLVGAIGAGLYGVSQRVSAQWTRLDAVAASSASEEALRGRLGL